MMKAKWRRLEDGSVVKTCTKCSREKPLGQYSRHRLCSLGLSPWCNQCLKDYRNEHIEEIRTKARRRYRKMAKDVKFVLKSRRKSNRYYRTNRIARLRYAESFRSIERHREKQSKYYKKYRRRHLRCLRSYCRKYQKRNRSRLNKYLVERRHRDPAFRLKSYVSSQVSTALKRRGYSKNGGSTFKSLGYSPIDLKRHLESLFTRRMSWKNYGSCWSVDHIIPRCRFPYTSLEDPLFLKCWNLKNLRPLPCKDNLRKGSR